MHYTRLLDLRSDVARRSVFLFGPRQTGKTTLLGDLFPDSLSFNLLQGDVFLRLSSDPSRLRQEIAAARDNPGPVVIDEIQKLPALLDEVHDLIEVAGRRFVLSGSSPVKLRRGGYNLLGGRARLRSLYPLVSAEVPGWDLNRTLRIGGIPSIYLSDQPEEDLRAYCGTYLQMEIQAEGLVRGIEPFSRFLAVAAATAGRQVNFEQVGNDAAVPPRTVREFYRILEDTLIGELIPVFTATVANRKPVAHGKFYFFDVGVANALGRRLNIVPGSDDYGRALENVVFCELRSYLRYRNDDRPLSFWRTRDGTEVDFLIGDEIAVEVKASARLDRRDLTGLRRLSEGVTLRRQVVVCGEAAPRRLGEVDVLPARDFFAALWAGEIL